MKKYAIIVLFVAMAAVGVLMHRAYLDNPRATVGEALRTAAAAKSFMSVVTVGTFAPESVLNAAGADPALALLPVVFVGEAAFTSAEGRSPSGTANFVLVGAQGDDGKDVTIDLVAHESGTSFVRFTNMPAGKEPSAVAGQIDGHWYSLHTRELAAMLLKDGQAAPVTGEPSPASVDAWARMRDAVLGGELFGLPVLLGTQVLGEVSARKYEVPLRPEALRAFVEDMTLLVRGRALTQEERDEIARDLAARTTTLTVWVDRRTKQLLQFNVDAKERRADGSDAPGGHLSVLVRFTAWDAPVEVVPPTDATPFADLVAEIKAKAGR